MTREERCYNFIENCKKKHPFEKLDYSKVRYINNRTNVIIIDHDLDENGVEYGEYEATPSNLLKGQGHPRKRGVKISTKKRFTQEEVIKKFEKVHKGENLDYSQVKYKNMHTKVKIISHELRDDGTEYGVFWQEPAVHLKGCTHPDIGKEKQARTKTYTTETFIEKAKTIHPEYDYSKVNYIKSQEKVCVTCNQLDYKGKVHGDFYICPDALLQGKGCPKCGNHLSTAEDEIVDFITKFLGDDSVIKRDKTVLEGQEIDIYVPSKKIGIEFNGIKWHSEQYTKDKYYHLNKQKKAREKNVTLLHIFEDEYLFHKDIVLDKIAIVLGFKVFEKKIPARKCVVREISKNDAETFLNRWHIQGYASSSVYMGTYYNNELIAVMTFTKYNNEWELTRYATNISYSCQGVAGKMFKHFVNMFKPLHVKSFLDLRWCYNENNMYVKLGFERKETLLPNYTYTNGHGKRIHKFRFRKKNLNKKYGFPMTMTEREMTEKLGYYKIWDCGLIKYVWENN